MLLEAILSSQTVNIFLIVRCFGKFLFHVLISSHDAWEILLLDYHAVSKGFESICVQLRMPLSQMIVHLIIVLLVEVNFIQLFSNFSDLYHSFFQPFCSFSCISFHLNYDFSRKRLQNLIKLNCFEYPYRCFSINWKRKISPI
mgnify:CR=1 FL=1